MEYGIDISDFFTPKRRLWEFWVFFSDLPEGSRTKSAVAMNEDIAKAQAAGLSEEDIAAISEARANGGSKGGDISPQGYSLEIEKLNQIIDSINLLRFVVRGSLGAKVTSSDFKTMERPKTAFEREVDKRVLAYEKKYQEQAMADFGF